MDRYVFDRTRMEFRKVTHSVWNILGKALKYFVITASLAVVYYIVFALLVNTDSERKLKRENQMYSRMYDEMVRKEQLVGDVLENLKVKDDEIYRQLFNNGAVKMVFGFVPGQGHRGLCREETGFAGGGLWQC